MKFIGRKTDTETARRQWLEKLERSAAEARARFVTPGKEQIYAKKVQEALNISMGRTEDAIFLPQEVGITARSLMMVAATVLERATETDKDLARVEGELFRRKAAVRKAKTPAEMQNIVEREWTT